MRRDASRKTMRKGIRATEKAGDSWRIANDRPLFEWKTRYSIRVLMSAQIKACVVVSVIQKYRVKAGKIRGVL